MASSDPLALLVHCILADVKDFEKVHSKSKELSRIILMKVPIGSLKAAESARSMIATELACRILNVPFNKTKLSQNTPTNEKDYHQGLVICKNVLNLNWDLSISERLHVQFGSSLKDSGAKLLNEYKLKYVQNIDKHLQANINLDSAVYHAAAIYYSAKQEKISIDKNRLLQTAEVDRVLFNGVLGSLEKFFAPETPSANFKKENVTTTKSKILASGETMTYKAAENKSIDKDVVNKGSRYMQNNSNNSVHLSDIRMKINERNINENSSKQFFALGLQVTDTSELKGAEERTREQEEEKAKESRAVYEEWKKRTLKQRVGTRRDNMIQNSDTNDNNENNKRIKLHTCNS